MLLLIFGGHKTVISPNLWPTVIFTGNIGSKHWLGWNKILFRYVILWKVLLACMKPFNKGRSITGRNSLVVPSFILLDVDNRLIWANWCPTFDDSLVVLLVGQNFHWNNLFWPIGFQYSIGALVRLYKTSFILLSRLMLALLLIVWILHTKEIKYVSIFIQKDACFDS